MWRGECGDGRGELKDFKVLTIWIRVSIYCSIKVVMWFIYPASGRCITPRPVCNEKDSIACPTSIIGMLIDKD